MVLSLIMLSLRIWQWGPGPVSFLTSEGPRVIMIKCDHNVILKHELLVRFLVLGAYFSLQENKHIKYKHTGTSMQRYVQGPHDATAM